MAAAKEVVSAVLMTKREAKQMPIYFVGHALRGPEVNYTSMEKLVLALVYASKRLKRYFQAHPIIAVMDQPIKQGQILADFIVERLEEDDPDCHGCRRRTFETVDFVYGRVILCGRLWSRTNTHKIKNSGRNGCKEPLGKCGFQDVYKKANTLSKIASTSFAHLSKQVLVEELKEKSINELEVLSVVEEEGNTWMTLIYEYLTEETLPMEVNKAIVMRCTRSVVAKALLTRYYWPTIHKDARALIRACQECQVHRPIPRNPQQKLNPITSPWPFYKW
ncbi:reverse transcriptase domain-containing protein [Tanacetum coccineum]